MCMDKINIVPIGSGSTGNCFYIEMSEYKFLIDMGIGYKKVKESLRVNNRSLEDIDAIFVSHGHGDHIKNSLAICNNTNCKVYTNETVMYYIKNVKADRITLDIGKSIDLFEGFKVKMFLIPHDFVKTCGFIFEYKDRKLGYLTDCGKMNDGIIKELMHSDVVIIEANHDIDMLKNGPYPKFLQDRILSKYGHLSNIECAKTINELYKYGTKNFLLAHLSMHNNNPRVAFDTVNDYLDKDDAFIYVCPCEGNEMLSF